MSPFTADPGASVSALGERRIIAAIRRWLGKACPPHPHGIGDDCAVVPWRKPGQDLLVTTDPVIHGRHFDASVPPRAVGGKLLRRNLSDIAAMGGDPVSAVVSVSLPENTSLAWLRAFYLGLAAAALRHNVPLVGGDLSSSNGDLAAHLTLIGRAPAGQSLTRTGARPGALLFVTGSLGGSILGKHHTFTPRLEEARWLASTGSVQACMDLSDGLAKDLPELIPAGCIAHIDAGSIPVSRAAQRLARTDGTPALRHAVCDGEDYELLLALDPDPARIRRLTRAFARRFNCGLHPIGRIEQAPAGLSLGSPIVGSDTQLDWAALSGYEHFRPSKPRPRAR